MSYLNIKDIEAIRQKKIHKQNESFEVILDSCFKQIRKRVELFPDVNVMFFDVPDFMLGYPLYKLEDCLKYVIGKIMSNGYNVKYIFPRVLCISWNNDTDKNKKDYLQLDTPVVKTACETPKVVNVQKSVASNVKSVKSKLNTTKTGKFILNLN
jgi:hypothetical protein